MEITSKKIPHNYRNKYLKSTSIIPIYNTNLSKQYSNDVSTRVPQGDEEFTNLQTQINALQVQINELKAQIDELKNTSGEIEDPMGGDGNVEDPTV